MTVPASRTVPSRLGSAGDMESMLTVDPGLGVRRRRRGTGSHRPQHAPVTTRADATSARAVHRGDPLLTGSSYSPEAVPTASRAAPATRSATPAGPANGETSRPHYSGPTCLDPTG